MPKDEDIRKLAQGLIERIKDLTSKQKLDGVNSTAGLNLIQACLVYFILFNRKRAGEAKWMLLSDYQEAKNENFSSDPELIAQMDQFEKKLAEQFLMMRLVGK